MKKTSSLLVAAILIMSFSSALMAKEKPGADIIVVKADGSQLNGELIAVKKDSLLLLAAGSPEGAVHSVAWETIIKVIVVRKSKLAQGLLLGGLIGGASGFLMGYAGGDDPGGFMSFSASAKGGLGAISFGLIGLVVGGIGGASSGADISIPVDSKSEAALRSVRAKLAEFARVKGIQ